MWGSSQQPLLCGFSLERYSPATRQLSCKVCVRQLQGHEQILHIRTAVLEVSPSRGLVALLCGVRRSLLMPCS